MSDPRCNLNVSIFNGIVAATFIGAVLRCPELKILRDTILKVLNQTF